MSNQPTLSPKEFMKWKAYYDRIYNKPESMTTKRYVIGKQKPIILMGQKQG